MYCKNKNNVIKSLYEVNNMELDLTGLRIDVTDAIRSFAEKKVKKLDKFFDDSTICHLTFTDKKNGTHDVDIRIEYKSHTYIAKEKAEDLYYGIEAVISKIESQIRKEKDSKENKRYDKVETPENE